MLKRLISVLCLVLLMAPSPALAAGSPADVAAAQTAWRLLDYIAVDYEGAVADGAIISDVEYAEMVEFAQQARDRIEALPAKPAQTELTAQLQQLQAAIADKRSPDDVAALAHQAAARLIEVYPVPLAPAAAPDITRGAELYRAECASCHGANGDGDGPLSEGLDPPAIAFTDRDRAWQRSVFGLAQVIDQGLDGTSMLSYSHLPAEDRWALAFHAAALAFSPAEVAAGKELWENNKELRQRIDAEKLVMMTPAALAAEIGESRATALMAYLRSNPQAVFAERQAGALALARQRLAEALAAYSEGRHKDAGNLALSAYLDGFEPIEPVVSARDKNLMVQVETAMANLRSSIARRAPIATVQDNLAAVDTLFAEVEQALDSNDTSATASFLGAFSILAREGLEAILIVIAMIAFLRKAERPEVLPYVHGGWIVALAAGGLTWVAATWLIEISGASRELTEGFGSLLAALVLLWVGLWMHGKSSARGWQQYIRGQMQGVLSRPSGHWLVFGLAFIVVYREVFETIIFYTALWAQGDGGAILAGALAAVVLLAVVAWAMMAYSKRLPIHEFFLYTSVLIAVLAVVLTGKGVAALQEAGYLPVTPMAALPRVELLGLYPTIEGVLAQLGMIVLIITGVLWNRRQTPAST